MADRHALDFLDRNILAADFEHQLEPPDPFDPALLVEDTVELPVSINGKVRARITVASDADEATVRAAALAEPNVLAHLGGSAPKKLIVVAGRMVNIVM